jgi:hypothetical protein
MSCPLITTSTPFWGAIVGITTTILWYADSKDIDIAYMPEMRLVLGLSAGILALTAATCNAGFL